MKAHCTHTNEHAYDMYMYTYRAERSSASARTSEGLGKSIFSVKALPSNDFMMFFPSELNRGNGNSFVFVKLFDENVHHLLVLCTRE